MNERKEARSPVVLYQIMETICKPKPSVEPNPERTQIELHSGSKHVVFGIRKQRAQVAEKRIKVRKGHSFDGAKVSKPIKPLSRGLLEFTLSSNEPSDIGSSKVFNADIQPDDKASQAASLFRPINTVEGKSASSSATVAEIPVHFLLGQNQASAIFFDHKLLKEMGLPTDDFEAIKIIQQTIPVKFLDQLSNIIPALPLNDVMSLLDIAKTTLVRRKSSGSLSVHESERFYQLVYVISLATEFTGSYTDAIEWLSTPAFALNQQVPFDLLKTSIGTEKLKTLLKQLNFGVVV